MMLQKPRGGHCTFHLRVSGKIFKQKRKRLFTDTVSVNKVHVTDTVSVN